MDTPESVFPIRNMRCTGFDLVHRNTPFNIECIISCDGIQRVVELQVNRVEGTLRTGAALVSRVLHGTITLQEKTVSVCVVHDPSPDGLSLMIRTDIGPDTERCKVLMDIIFKMIALYQAHNAGHLSNKIFELFEAAKVVSWAKDARELADATKNIPKVTLPE